MPGLRHTNGWIRDRFDSRDRLYRYSPAAEPLPVSVDLRPGFIRVPVEDQGSIGSCTANALVSALEYLRVAAGHSHRDLSRLFVYYNERYLEGTIDLDAGAELRNGIKVLARWGACLENLWPYIPNRFQKMPSPRSFDDAITRRVTEYQRISTIRGIKRALAAGMPIVFGFTMFESSESQEVERTGRIPLPQVIRGWFRRRREQAIGGHAVLAVGYDDNLGTITFRNSWGSAWGDNGYGYLPYQYFTDPDLSGDFWVITKTQFGATQ